MAKAPPIPRDQRPARGGGAPNLDEGPQDRRDLRDGVQSNEPGDADLNLKEQGRYGNRSQNVDSVHWKQQER